MGTDGEKRRVKARFVSDRIRRKTASAPACVRPTGTPDRAPMDARSGNPSAAVPRLEQRQAIPRTAPAPSPLTHSVHRTPLSTIPFDLLHPPPTRKAGPSLATGKRRRRRSRPDT
ncbi:TPA: hypothetical protein QDE31_22030 [Burkholderia cenocepacia]|nr:hypothetical protein [Burkholderia cenocepacia]